MVPLGDGGIDGQAKLNLPLLCSLRDGIIGQVDESDPLYRVVGVKTRRHIFSIFLGGELGSITELSMDDLGRSADFLNISFR